MKVPMHTRATFFVFVALIMSSALAVAAPEFNSQLKASWLTLMPAGEKQSKPSNRGALKVVFGSTITDKASRANPEECSQWELQKQILSHAGDFAAQTQEERVFFHRCDKILRRWAPHSFEALMKLGYGNYEILKRPHIFEAIFDLPYGARIHGLLAIKDMTTPRPFVIVICGTGCDLGDPTARDPLLTFYDTAPFNVLVLPSISGTAFIRENHTYAIGGFEEGRQTFELVRLLEGSDSPFRKIISSFHIFGQSLGGNGALLTSVYASYNNDLLTGAKVQSVFGYHPVVDLKASLLSLDRNDFTGRYFNKVIWHSILDNFSFVPGLPNVNTTTPLKAGSKRSVKFLEKYVYPRYQLLANEKQFLLAPFTTADLATPEKFWDSNNFLNFFKKVTVPTLVFFSDADFIVDPKVNGLALQKRLIPEDEKFVNVLETTHGAHTAVEYTYGHEIFAALAQSFVLAQSPEFDLKSRTLSLSVRGFEGMESVKLRTENERFFGYKWKGLRNKTYVTVTFSIWNPDLKVNDHTLCSTGSPYYAFESCFRHETLRIPLEKLHLEAVQSQAQAHALTRFLNFRIKIVNEKGQEVIDSILPPTHLEWYAD